MPRSFFIPDGLVIPLGYHGTGATARQGDTMKADIHPAYEKVSANCSCGNVIQTRSTLAKDLHIDVCSKCHPFYSGKQKVLDTGGRIDRFKKRFGSAGARRPA
jgi:large subunit ribosomal protein L31